MYQFHSTIHNVIIMKNKKRFRGLFPIIILFLTSSHLYPQTYSELYDLDFTHMTNVGCSWMKESVYVLCKIDSTIFVNGKHPIKIGYPKLTFDPGISTNERMYMNFYQMLVLP